MIRKLKRAYGSESQVLPLVQLFPPRLWMVLLVLAFPFFGVCAHYFEALEQTGAAGAFIADTLLPASALAYLALVFALKKRRM